MSDDSAPERDAAGRFIRTDLPQQDTALQRDDDVHPAAKFLFGWVASPRTPAILLAFVLALSAFLIIIDLAVERHEYVGFANATGFYGFWGFAAFGLAVLSGWPLGALLRRSEDYYDEADTVPADIDEALDGEREADR